MTSDKRKNFSSAKPVRICLSFFVGSRLFAGDAVAIGYNADWVWTDVTYYRSATPKRGKDYKTEKQARELAIRDVRKRSQQPVVKLAIISASDSTGYVAVARAATEHGNDLTLVGRGRSQAEADAKALDELKQNGATKNQKIVYQDFCYGADSK